MKIKLISDKKIAETSSKGNQEKWFDESANKWYKLDQYGYEAAAEAVASRLAKLGNIQKFGYVKYYVESVEVHGYKRLASVSESFLGAGCSIITLNQLLSKADRKPLVTVLAKLSSNKKRIEYIAEKTAEVTGLKDFPKYLTMLFEFDGLILNTDRHLNNIAVIEKSGKYDYCPFFDNGAAFLSDTRIYPMDILPKALISSAVALPFSTTFNRQINICRELYGKQLEMPELDRKTISAIAEPFIEFYPKRDKSLISGRITECILIRQKKQLQ